MIVSMGHDAEHADDSRKKTTVVAIVNFPKWKGVAGQFEATLTCQLLF